MSDQQNFKYVKLGSTLMFTMLFCCILSVLIISVKDLKCGEILIESAKKLCRFTTGSSAMEFLIRTVLVIAGILAAYKHLFYVIILVATLALLLLIDNSIWLDYWDRKSNEKLWDAKCAETVAFCLCFLSACTLAFFIKRHQP
jgi:predicted membrane metal-binding protein